MHAAAELGGKKAMLAEEVVMDASELSTSRENKSSKSLATAGGFQQSAVCCHRHLCSSALLQIESHLEAQAAQTYAASIAWRKVWHAHLTAPA